MISLLDFIKKEKKIIYPFFDDIFYCFKVTPFDNVNVVILGQDPYCFEKQAHGLSFSVPEGIALPSSLKNIYKELNDDLGIPISNNGCLLNWSYQGVLLLNIALTVEKGKPGSHLDIGWEIFTDKVIKLLSESKKKIIFVLWGKHALSKQNLIDLKKNFIISSSHPSGKSSFISFFGSRPFSKINMHLKLMNESLINWDNS